MGLKLKIVKGHTTNERMKSIDGLLNTLAREPRNRDPDKKLIKEIANLRQTITVLLDHLGLVIESGPRKVIRQVRLIEDEAGADNSL